MSLTDGKTHYWFDPDSDPMVFGVTFDLDADKEWYVKDHGEEEAEKDWKYLHTMLEHGVVLGRCYSQAVPDGEVGFTPVDGLRELTESVFEFAQSINWDPNFLFAAVGMKHHETAMKVLEKMRQDGVRFAPMIAVKLIGESDPRTKVIEQVVDYNLLEQVREYVAEFDDLRQIVYVAIHWDGYATMYTDEVPDHLPRNLSERFRSGDPAVVEALTTLLIGHQHDTVVMNQRYRQTIDGFETDPPTLVMPDTMPVMTWDDWTWESITAPPSN